MDHLGLGVSGVLAGGAQQALQQQRVVAHELAELAVRDAAQYARLERVRRVAPHLVAREEARHSEDLALLVAAHRQQAAVLGAVGALDTAAGDEG